MKKGKKSVVTVVVVIVVAFSLLGFGGLSSLFGGSSEGPSKSTRELALSCTLDVYTKFHIHPHLTITINGQQQTVPASVGISFSCMHPLHTHDDTGEIHVESPEQRDFTLGDFFAVWDRPFGKDQILDYRADATHEIVMTVDDKPSTEFENLVLKDKEEIVIEYKKK